MSSRNLLWFGWCLCLGQDVSTRPAETPQPEGPPRAMYSARIAMEDGTPPPVQIQILNFGGCRIERVFGSGVVTFGVHDQQFVDHVRRAPVCSAWVMAPGIRSQSVVLRDGAVAVLKRLGEHEGSMISITVLRAPAAAQKSYGKGAEALRKNKLAEARKRFEQAVAIYPDYALAWSELGAVLEKMGDIETARAALRQSIRADRMYLKPLVQLAGLEARSGNWKECAASADEAIRLNAIEFPGAYYYRGLAHMQAEEWDAAVQAGRKAIQLDSRMEQPDAYLLLATALDRKGNRRGAVDVLNLFLSSRPAAADARQARALLDSWERSQ